jgi:cellulose synthase/poly-beta-1,6-N-acetylglucosamine synthase-like glycosyltransferase
MIPRKPQSAPGHLGRSAGLSRRAVTRKLWSVAPYILATAVLVSSITFWISYAYIFRYLPSLAISAPQSARHPTRPSDSAAAAASPFVGRPLGLQRSLYAINLELALDADSNVGPCLRGMPSLDDMEPLDCARLFCMWSAAAGRNIDLWFRALDTMSSDQYRETCAAPRGGQLGLRSDRRATLAFVITAHNSPQLAAQALLEAFRVSGEAESVEFVVVDDGSTEDMRLLSEACERLTAFFGLRVRYLVNAEAAGFGAANMRGVRATNAEYVMLLNSDAFVMKGAVHALLRTHRELPKVGGCRSSRRPASCPACLPACLPAGPPVGPP